MNLEKVDIEGRKGARKIMSKKLVFGILGSVLFLTALGVYIVVGSMDQPSEGVNSSETTADTSEGATETDTDETGKEKGTPNPFEPKVKTPLKEELIQQYIHAMSHQKVAADEKWSFFEITEERIDFLLEQLEVNNYKHDRLYKEILTSWKKGDFSEADRQHNAVWKLQNGSIGEAKGLLSPKAEEAYLQKQNRESR
jgi:hypothetical protein